MYRGFHKSQKLHIYLHKKIVMNGVSIILDFGSV